MIDLHFAMSSETTEIVDCGLSFLFVVPSQNELVCDPLDLLVT